MEAVTDPAGTAVNPCKACAPLGASLAMKGVKNSMCILHGSQGCATYIRRYFIGHFREPVDIASSSFDENTAIFGGRKNLLDGISNIVSTYNPEVVGIATSCLAETIGEDVAMYIKDLPAGDGLSYVHAETAAYRGTHADGFMKMTASLCGLAEKGSGSVSGSPSDREKLRINLIPWMLSPADIRHLKRILADTGIDAVVLPDYSLTLDGTAWDGYQPVPEGGTDITSIKSMGSSDYTVEFGLFSTGRCSPAAVIEKNTGVPGASLPLPVGLRNTDRFLNGLRMISELNDIRLTFPAELEQERGRLLDAYADAHKYLSGTSAAVYGEADFVEAMTSFICELGIRPLYCMTGEKTDSGFADGLNALCAEAGFGSPEVLTDADFTDMEKVFGQELPDMMIGNSKGYQLARSYELPLFRAGFPIHDRFGGQRRLHVAYSGALAMTDEITNLVIGIRQEKSPVGYMSM